jgi:LysR family transcriptional regulator, hca operon transcriptional activator
VGILVGHEADCLPAAATLLQDELNDLEVRVFSGFSINLADDLLHGKLDVAFLRREPNSNLEYRLVMSEPLVVILPSDHRLVSREAIEPREFVGETFIGISSVPRVLRAVVNDYLAKSGVDIVPHLEIDNFAMAISLVTSTRGVALLPASIESFLPASMTSRPLAGEEPTVELMMGYHKANRSAVLRRFLARFDELAEGIRGKGRPAQRRPPAPYGISGEEGDNR